MNKIVNVYIDGYNFYYALKNKIAEPWSKRKNSYKRCDFKMLFTQFLQDGEILWDVYFFTSYKIRDAQAIQNHKKYNSALNSVWVKIILWKYIEKKHTYRKWNNRIVSMQWRWSEIQKMTCLELLQTLEYVSYEEKETDVKLALQIVSDAFLNKYQKAIIVTGDSDILPALQTVRTMSSLKQCEHKQFMLVLIPWTKWRAMRHYVDTVYEITADMMEGSILQ